MRTPPRGRTIATKRGAPARLISVCTVIVVAIVFSIEIWAVVPAPTLPLLALAVIVPEVAPWGVLVTLVSLPLALRFTWGRTRIVATTAALLALVCAAFPLVLMPQTLANADAAFASLGSRPVRADAAMLRRPFDLRLFFTGFPDAPSVRVRRNEPVIVRDGTRLALDVYEASASGPRPAIVLIYGGAWLFGSRDVSAELGRSFARLGYTAVAIDYRHAPQFRFPTQLNDVEDALGTIARNARRWRVDTRRVALLGRSAGAELALLAAYRPQPLTIRAVVGYYSPTDLARGYASPPVPDPADIRSILRAYLGGTPARLPDTYARASPVASVRAHLPPTLLIGGARDELIRLSLQRELRDALRRSADPVFSIELPWSNHAFDSLPNDVAGQIARYYTQRFLYTVL